jgi:hypothetical protein
LLKAERSQRAASTNLEYLVAALAALGKTSEGQFGGPAFRKPPIASDNPHYINLE